MKKLIKSFDGMDQHNAWDFENVQANFVQIEVGKFQTESKNSGGQKRLSLAIILINRPDLLI
jgi:ATP-binding cassette subfamily F protein uup